jgi:hypothetical protein
MIRTNLSPSSSGSQDKPMTFNGLHGVISQETNHLIVDSPVNQCCTEEQCYSDLHHYALMHISSLFAPCIIRRPSKTRT